jgi:hypothetical protein
LKEGKSGKTQNPDPSIELLKTQISRKMPKLGDQVAPARMPFSTTIVLVGWMCLYTQTSISSKNAWLAGSL